VEGQALVLDRTRLAFALDEATDLLTKRCHVDSGNTRLRAAAARTELSTRAWLPAPRRSAELQ
jgi:hypothetical protein